nr:transcription factor PCF1-like [Ipomoea batatas]
MKKPAKKLKNPATKNPVEEGSTVRCPGVMVIQGRDIVHVHDTGAMHHEDESFILPPPYQCPLPPLSFSMLASLAPAHPVTKKIGKGSGWCVRLPGLCTVKIFQLKQELGHRTDCQIVE